MFIAHSNRPRKSLFVVESEPWCHSMEGRERRNVMQFFSGVLKITIINWVSEKHAECAKQYWIFVPGQQAFTERICKTSSGETKCPTSVQNLSPESAGAVLCRTRRPEFQDSLGN